MPTHHQKPLRHLRASIAATKMLSPCYCAMTLRAPDIAGDAVPGQFVQLRPAAPDTTDPLLARPISIYQVDAEQGLVSVLIKIVGRGTAMLASYTPGQTISVLGPIGRGFQVPDTASAVLLVAGGVGMPPLYFLASTLRRARPTLAIDLCYGGCTAADLLALPSWAALGVGIYTSTDDGTHGHYGLVTAVVQQRLAARAYDYLATCGPHAMMRAVQGIARAAGLAGQASLEARMACGVGACLACVCGTVGGRRRVCVDGPVFKLDEVQFDG